MNSLELLRGKVSLAGSIHVSGYTRTNSAGRTEQVSSYFRSPGKMSTQQVVDSLEALSQVANPDTRTQHQIKRLETERAKRANLPGMENEPALSTEQLQKFVDNVQESIDAGANVGEIMRAKKKRFEKLLANRKPKAAGPADFEDMDPPAQMGDKQLYDAVVALESGKGPSELSQDGRTLQKSLYDEIKKRGGWAALREKAGVSLDEAYPINTDADALESELQKISNLEDSLAYDEQDIVDLLGKAGKDTGTDSKTVFDRYNALRQGTGRAESTYAAFTDGATVINNSPGGAGEKGVVREFNPKSGLYTIDMVGGGTTFASASDLEPDDGKPKVEMPSKAELREMSDEDLQALKDALEADPNASGADYNTVSDILDGRRDDRIAKRQADARRDEKKPDAGVPEIVSSGYVKEIIPSNDPNLSSTAQSEHNKALDAILEKWALEDNEDVLTDWDGFFSDLRKGDSVGDAANMLEKMLKANPDVSPSQMAQIVNLAIQRVTAGKERN